MNVRNTIALAACGAAVMFFTGCSGPVKVTGGGKAIGEAWDLTLGGGYYENVTATAAGQVQLTELNDGDSYDGTGNFQFVDHVTGMCFHADLVVGGGLPDAEGYVWIFGFVRDCGSEDGLFDDGIVDLWLYDSGMQGPDKGDGVYVARYDADDNLIYVFAGELTSGNYKIHKVKTK